MSLCWWLARWVRCLMPAAGCKGQRGARVCVHFCVRACVCACRFRWPGSSCLHACMHGVVWVDGPWCAGPGCHTALRMLHAEQCARTQARARACAHLHGCVQAPVHVLHTHLCTPTHPLPALPSPRARRTTRSWASSF